LPIVAVKLDVKSHEENHGRKSRKFSPANPPGAEKVSVGTKKPGL
jgi:hypothetical protein